MALKVAKTKRYGTPDPRWPEADMLNERRYTVGDVLGQTLQQFSYSYDFGGGWDHTIAVEQRLVGVEGKNTWPMCIDGENACPSEDVSGPPGCMDFLEALHNPTHAQDEDMWTWVGRHLNFPIERRR